MSLSVFTQIVSENNIFTIMCKENKWSYKRREWNISAYSSYSVLKQKLLSGKLKNIKNEQIAEHGKYSEVQKSYTTSNNFNWKSGFPLQIALSASF